MDYIHFIAGLAIGLLIGGSSMLGYALTRLNRLERLQELGRVTSYQRGRADAIRELQQKEVNP